MAGVAVVVDRVDLVVVAAGLLALSSAAAMRPTKSSTSFSKCSILAYCSWCTSLWSRMSDYSYVISPSISRSLSLVWLCLSSCSSLTSTAASPFSRTVSSKLLPAVWTVLMEASASFFHDSSYRWVATRLAMNAAWVLRLSTTCWRKRWTS